MPNTLRAALVAVVVFLLAGLPGADRELRHDDIELEPTVDLPSGFYVENAASGATFDTPVGIAFAPDGRIFVAEKGGRGFIIQNGVKLTAP